MAPAAPGDDGFDRRSFIKLVGGTAGAGLLPANFACIPGGFRVVDSTHVPTPDEPLTPTEQFYITDNFGVPDPVPPTRWRLHIDGLVDRETRLTLDDLMAMAPVTREHTLECIGNTPGGSLISSAAFTGVPLMRVMVEAGLSRRARGLRFLGLDGYPIYLPVAVAETDVALIVVAMNGEPLTVDHGAPVRLLLPGRYGMFSVKWLDSVTAARTYHTWGALRGLAPQIDGIKRVRSRIDGPSDRSEARVGTPVVVTGLAATPGVGVARIQVQVDDEWNDAEVTFNRVEDGRSPYLWSLYRFEWTPQTPGQHILRVRAFDLAGQTQSRRYEFPYDSSAIHAVRVLVGE